MKPMNRNTDPIELVSIGAAPYLSQLNLPHVQNLTLNEYERINQHDPFTIYVITDQNIEMIYRGNTRVCRGILNIPKYYIGTEDIDGRIYYVIYCKIGNRTGMVDICRFEKSADAITALESFNALGTHEFCDHKIFSIVRYFVVHDIGFLQMMIGCLSSAGFRKDPELQRLIELQRVYRSMCTNEYDVPIYVIKDLNNSDCAVHKLYTEIYPILLELIDGKKVTTDENLLKRVTADIVRRIFE